ncbi:hypothetical protein Dimus_037939 [Dionaea muscipula]
MWFDPLQGMKVHPHYNLVEINHKKKYMKYEPFVLAQQAGQVYFTAYPSKKNDKRDWWAVCKVKERGAIDGPPQTYQEEVIEMPSQIATIVDEPNSLVHPDGEFINLEDVEVDDGDGDAEDDENDEIDYETDASDEDDVEPE